MPLHWSQGGAGPSNYCVKPTTGEVTEPNTIKGPLKVYNLFYGVSECVLRVPMLYFFVKQPIAKEKEPWYEKNKMPRAFENSRSLFDGSCFYKMKGVINYLR